MPRLSLAAARLILDHLLVGAAWESAPKLDPTRVGIVGHSFGGWTALAAPEADERLRAVVALAPGGSSNPPPGIIPCTLTYAWRRDVPTLYLVAEDDTALPLAGMLELFERTRATRRMVVLRRADHEHFCDVFEERTALCSKQEAHLFVRGLTLCHFDDVLMQGLEARNFWAQDVQSVLARRGLEALVR